MPRVTLADFAESFGVSVNEMPEACQRLIAEKDFSYEVLCGEARDRIILNVLQRTDADTQVIGAEGRKEVWFRGWAEALDAFVQSGYSTDALVPRFLREGQVVRWRGQYVQPTNPRFELDFITVFRTWLFSKYFAAADNLYEFGCGTGFNLVLAARIFPAKQMTGFDFVQSSVDLANKIGETAKLRIRGRLFDMINPDESVTFPPNSAVLTFGAVEQLAGKTEKFIQFLLQRRPRLCVHVEPTIEQYDESTLFDHLAARFHRKRGYTQGFLPRLQELEAQGKLRIHQIRRPYFGSMMMEGYTYFVWEPA